jgi:MoxR-like ATPase
MTIWTCGHFFGRESEMERATNLLQHKHLLVGGPGGIGKTSLVNRCSNESGIVFRVVLYFSAFEISITLSM